MTEQDHTSDGQYRDAMATGSDAGAPGDHLPEPPLSPQEQALLADLQRSSSGESIEAVEDSPQMIRAVEDDSPLPASGGDFDPGYGDDDVPIFEAPGE